MQNQLKITGTGTLSITPDQVILRFPLSYTYYEYQDAISALTDSVNQLKAVIENAGIDKKELKTTNFNVSRETQWSKKEEQSVFVGFRASNDLSLSIPLDHELLNKLITKIASTIQGVEFSIQFAVKDPEKHTQEMLKKAVADAKTNAEVLAAAAGVELKEIMNIDYSFNEVTFTSREFHNTALMASDASPSFPDMEPADLRASKSVTIVWGIG